MGPSLSPPTILIVQQKEWQTFRGNYLEIVYNYHFVQSLNFPPFEPPIKTNDYGMVLYTIQHSETSIMAIAVDLHH